MSQFEADRLEESQDLQWDGDAASCSRRVLVMQSPSWGHEFVWRYEHWDLVHIINEYFHELLLLACSITLKPKRLCNTWTPGQLNSTRVACTPEVESRKAPCQTQGREKAHMLAVVTTATKTGSFRDLGKYLSRLLAPHLGWQLESQGWQRRVKTKHPNHSNHSNMQLSCLKTVIFHQQARITSCNVQL